MKNKTKVSFNNGFSLVELLVVIAIISLIAGASYPAIIGKIKDAKIAEANKQAKDLVIAIEGFEQKYDYLPYTGTTPPTGIIQYSAGSGGTAISGLLQVLMGKETTTNINPNKIQFFEFQSASNGVNGLIYGSDGVTPAALKDPFGNDFTVYIDYSGANTFDLSTTIFNGQTDNDGNAVIVRATSAIAGSEGPDREFYDASNSDEDDDVKSW